MARRTMADRLQDNFESKPLTAHRSLEVGVSDRLYLRGWDGWPQGARAIIAATRQ
jgi:hypothetical protein